MLNVIFSPGRCSIQAVIPKKSPKVGAQIFGLMLLKRETIIEWRPMRVNGDENALN